MTELNPTEREESQGVAPPAQARETASNTSDSHHMFGRGLAYVLIWSLQLVAGTVVSPILAHLLGPAEFGRLASAIALYQVLSVIALLGLDKAITLQRAEDEDGAAARGVVFVGMVLALGLTALLGSLLPLWSVWLGFGPHSTLVLATVLWTFPGASVQMMLALLVAEDRLAPFAVVNALSAVGGQLIGLGLLLSATVSAATYAWGGVVSQLVAMAVGVAVTRPAPHGIREVAVARRAISLGIPLTLSGLSFFVLNAGDRIIVQRFLGPVQVGRYQVAYTVGSVAILLLTYTTSAWAPRFAGVADVAERWELGARARDSMYRLLIPVVLSLALIAPAAVRLLAPPSFVPQGLSLVVLVVAVAGFPVAAAGITSLLLLTLRRGRQIATATAVAAVSNILLNIVLVPHLGIVGAALATLASFGLLAWLQRRLLPSEPRLRGPSPATTAAVATGCAVAAASVALPQTPQWNIARCLPALACAPWFFLQLRTSRRGV